MRQQRVRTACGGWVAVFVLGLAVSASAQGQGSLQASAAAQTAAPGTVKQLTLDQAVQLALENNLGLQVQRLEPEVQDANITLAKSVWTPNLTGAVRASQRNSPASGFFAGAEDVLTRDGFVTNVGADQLLPFWGSSYSVSWDTARNESNSVYDTPNPSLMANINFNFTQPLLRNLKVDAGRQQLIVSKANREISDLDLRQTVLTTVRSVKYAYWDLKASQAALRVAQQSLDLAREQLRNNRTRVEVGTMAPIDIVEAEAEVATREEAVILGIGTVDRAADLLRTLIFPQDMAGYWSVMLDPTDQAVLERRMVNADEAVKTALEKRTDLRAARKNLQVTDSNLVYYKNQTLPDLNAVLGYGQTGQGGTEKIFGEGGFPPPVIGEIEEGYGTVLSRMIKPDYNNWSIALQVSYPLGTSNADATIARARVQKNQQVLQLKDLELRVATSVRDVARQVDTNWKRLEATQSGRRFQERRLESEQKKFAAGLSTNFLVFQAQRDLADAQYRELIAALDYNRSLIDFETVQEAPTSGGSNITIR